MNKSEVTLLSTQKLLSQLHTSADQGLTSDEANIRLNQQGKNVLKKGTNSALQILLRQFKSPLVYLFMLAAVLSFFLRDVTDGVVITVILIINALLGFFQEYRSEQAIEKLAKFISKQIFVIRDGKTSLLDEQQIVCGDIVLVREGDIVPADIKLLETENLAVDESELTGESVPVTKTVENHSEKNATLSFIFAGSVIEKGSGKGVVYATANDTELGKIAHLSTNTKRITQYEQSLQNFSYYLMRVILITLVLIFLGKLVIVHDLSQVSTLFLFVIALAVTVIPEALPVIAIVTLSHGALKLAKKKVVVKRLSALEDLGNVNLLCTDKTGTLTENTLTIQQIFAADLDFFQQLAFASIEDLQVKKRRLSNSYDLAFQQFIPKNIQNKVSSWTQAKEIPFDPAARRRRMIVIDPSARKTYFVTVGSVETLLEIANCSQKKEYLHAIQADGERGIRHIGIAYKELPFETELTNFDLAKAEHHLEFVGYAQLVDPLRPSAKHTIELAERLGIAIKILTGDSKEVAAFIGQQVGLLKEQDIVYDGAEVDQMSDLELEKAVETCAVFARVTPEQKYKIIGLLKKHHVVGYQGDGINDAPSLKLADVAMAVNTATDVAKDSADIVLLEDDLSSIVNGIHYGRSIFVNINKYIKHTMVGNLGSFFSLAILYLVSFGLPQLPIQLLLGNLIQDIPLITIYSDTVDDQEVKRPQQYNLRSIMLISLFLGGFSAVYNFIFFAMVGFTPSAQTETMLFLFFTFTQLTIIFSVRNKRHLWQGKKPSKLLLGSVIGFAILALTLVYVPLLAKLFGFSPLPIEKLGIIMVSAIIYIFVLDYIKVYYFKLVQKNDRISSHRELQVTL